MFQYWPARRKSPGRVVRVFVKNRDAVLWHDSRQFLNHEGRIGNEGEHPSTPAEVIMSGRQIVGHEIQSVDSNLIKTAQAACLFDHTDELVRSLNRNDFASRSDDLR